MNILLKILKALFLLLICACLFLVFAYFHPTKETMNCNGNYECSVEHNYFNLYKYGNTFTLNSKSEISNIKQTPWWNFKGSSFMYLTYDENKPFIYFFQEEGEEKYYEILFNDEKEVFTKYLKNPSSGYTVESMAERSIILYILLVIFIICPAFFKIFLDLYFGIKKSEKKEKKSAPKPEKAEKKSEEKSEKKEEDKKPQKKPESRFAKKPESKFNRKPTVKKPEVKKTETQKADDKKQDKKTENKTDKKPVKKPEKKFGNNSANRNFKKPPFKKP